MYWGRRSECPEVPHRLTLFLQEFQMSSDLYELKSDVCQRILDSGMSTDEYRPISTISELTDLPSQVVASTLTRLIDIGVPIATDADGNLKLLRPITPINECTVREIVSKADENLSSRIQVLPEIDSTNEFLLKLPTLNTIHRQVCVAEYMTSGRGRRGRSWHTGAFQNIMLSIAWKFDGGRRYFPGLSLVIAVVVVRCLQQMFEMEFQVKWPNDILWHGRKIGGILVEIRESTAVIGLGLNCHLSDEARLTVGQPVAALAEISGVNPNRTKLTGALIIALDAGLGRYAKSGLGAFGDDWMRFHAHTGKRVRADEGDAVTGTITGIDDEGALLIRTPNGNLTSVRSGGVEVLE